MKFEGGGREEKEFEIFYETKGVKLPEKVLKIVPGFLRRFCSEERVRRTIVAENGSEARVLVEEQLEMVGVDPDDWNCTVISRRD